MKAQKAQQNSKNTQELDEASNHEEQEEQYQQQPIDLISDQYQQTTTNHLQHNQKKDKQQRNPKEYASVKINRKNVQQDNQIQNKDEVDTANGFVNIRSQEDVGNDEIGEISLSFTQQQGKKGKKSTYQSVRGQHSLTVHSQQNMKRKAIRLGLGLIITLVIVLLVGIGALSKDFSIKTSSASQAKLTCIFLITSSQKKALHSILSFLDSNSCYKVIIASHFDYSKSKNTSNLVQNLKNYNIEWVIQKRPAYDLFFIDQLIKKVQTQYYFYANTLFSYKDDSFVKYSLEILGKFPEVGQLMGIVGNQTENTQLGARKVGFSWMPGVHRKKDYGLAADGYASIAKEASNNLEQAEYILSQFYRSKGLYVMAAPGDFKIEDFTEIKPKTTQTKKRPQQNINNKNIVKKQDKPVSKTIQPTPQIQPFIQPQIKQQIKPQVKPQIQPLIQPQTQPKKQEQPPVIYPPIRKNNIQPRQKVGQYLTQLAKLMTEPIKIFEIHLLKQHNELPICILTLHSQKYSEQSLDTSIKSQDYKNYKIVRAPSPAAPNQNRTNYFSYFEHLQKNCEENSFIMFVTAPLRQGALTYINKMLQEYRAWAIYAKSDVVVEVVGFYLRIYQMLNTNDFGKANQEILTNENKVAQTLGMLQLCLQAAKDVQRDLIYTDTNFYSYFSVLKSDESKLQRGPYKKIIRLSQDVDINAEIAQRSRAQIKAGRFNRPAKKLTKNNMYRAVDREQQWFLPSSHSIQQLQLQQYSSLYNITSNFQKQKQVHFCVTVLSHNNIQNNRYIKVMKSIVMQKYDNYHIVFIDDNSTDSNMNGTIQFMNKIKFPKQRITYVQNLRRNFATYNIINAAFNFCGEDDVQMLMDGDDEFIGKYAFHVMNAAYQQQQDIWVAYSNYKTNFYVFGRSRGMNSEHDHAAGNKRSLISIFGAIRTFRVKVIYNIPPLHHKMRNGQWLDTVYDDALSHPLFQLSGYKRVAYINEVLYEYNIKYGDNDDSTNEKIKHRLEVYRYMTSIPILAKLKTLAGSVKNADIQAQLKADFNVRYKVIQG